MLSFATGIVYDLGKKISVVIYDKFLKRKNKTYWSVISLSLPTKTR